MWPTGRDLVLRLTAIDSSVAEQAAMGERTCAACLPSKVGELMGELVSQVLGDALGRPGERWRYTPIPMGQRCCSTTNYLGGRHSSDQCGWVPFR